ncbi:aminotransferase class III-fold pyridoxal phosphate-dependent enzyme [Candidatus Poribacteria bacterium]|nr:aminotransferase class III-fold pyridoxal phosphate-dependent enzyme [Candidatus Poribacteria bacterium]MYG05206.1 aminotransferase class III-fold pyridoxal phosphate-dependent enzyme [Candidatus Poribacteria bacterium]MYK21905.1 aminotransferase class III-fold pyridoxal phosphate-dependent enzyme [Candidatus Poribacteria bacterium]
MAKDYRQVDKAHVWHPLFQHQRLEETALAVFESAHGTTLVDAEGNEYLDAYSALWNVNVGYGRQEIADAVYEQIQKLPYYPHSQINVPATMLAEQLAACLPGDLNHVYFCNSGSEANETAIKIARQYGRQTYPGENRYKIISRYRGYHGFTYGAMSATGQARRRKAFEPLVPGFPHAHPPYCYRCPIGLDASTCGIACADDIERIIQGEGPETVIGIIAEPIIGGGGAIVSPDEYLPKLRQICDDYGLLLILDEVITGFGRTGKMFACEHWGVQPDLITLAKGLTSGYLPLGACVASTKVFNAFLGDTDENREFAQVCTYGGHPVACAAGIANLKILQEERLWENAEKVGTYLLSKLETLCKLPIVGDVRGKGLMIGVELIETDGSHLATAKTNQIVGQLREKGVIVGKIGHAVEEPENIIYIAPPLILTEAEADRIFETLHQVLVQQEF